MEATNLSEQGANLYKFQIASVINSIIHRKKSHNRIKMKCIESIKDTEDFKLLTGRDSALHKKREEISLPFMEIGELVTKALDPFEMKRLVEKTRLSKERLYSFHQVMKRYKE